MTYLSPLILKSRTCAYRLRKANYFVFWMVLPGAEDIKIIKAGWYYLELRIKIIEKVVED